MIRVVLIDDQPLIRSGFRALLEGDDQVLSHRQARKHAATLRHEADAPAGDRLGR